VISITLVIAVIAGGGAVWLAARDHQARLAVDVRTATTIAAMTPRSTAFEALPSVASVTVYRASGELIANYTRHAEPPALYGLAARLAPGEVRCDSDSRTTVCVETTPAPLAIRLQSALMLTGVTLFAAILFGALGGVWLNRRFDARLAGITGVVDRAARDRDYSLRVEACDGNLGRTAACINELLAHVQERELVLRRRSLELEAANRELESFSYSVSHDLRAPLGGIDGFVQALQMDCAEMLDDAGKEYLQWIRDGCHRMRELIEGLLQMSRVSRGEVQRETVDLSSIARNVADSLRQANPERAVRFEIRDGVRAVGDERLLRAVLENLMNNAWKFTRHRQEARIEFGTQGSAYYVRDNGAGFDPTHAAKMFRPFQRLHSAREFEGTGIGLATVHKIIERHGGRAWAEGEVERGATIFFTTGSEDRAYAT
jgi:signal transduction histidine kinase